MQKSIYPAWAPRFWHGMRTSDWFRLMWRNRFRIHPMRWGLAGTITATTLVNSSLSLVNRLAWGRHLSEVKLVEDPVFIVGHWRSGTTYLHELLSCDARFATPTSFQCFAASHFLVSQAWMPRLLWFLMPSRRPMDNVQTSWDSPQEDEFALCSLGMPSPYLRIAFPNEPHDYLDYLDLRDLPEPALRQWQAQLEAFLKSLTLTHHKRLVLKSPTHTARVAVLAQMFPRARFLHIVRNPLAIYPSTIKLWRVLDEVQGLQRPHHRRLDAYVLDAFERMYRAFEDQRRQLKPEQLFELRYEDLVDDPIPILREAYRTLDLGDFEAVRPELEAMTHEKRRYQTNQYELSAAQQEEVLSRWESYARRYGYLE